MSAPLRKNAEVLAEHLPVEGRRVLDIGAGTGPLTRLLARRGAEVVALEPQAALMQAASAKAVGGDRYVAGAGEALPFADGSFAVTLFFNALHHVPVALMDAALTEALRVTAPGGTLAVLEPVAAGPHQELMKTLDDETEVRAAAIAALERMVEAGAAQRRLCLEYDTPALYESFEAWAEGVVTVDPARRAKLEPRRAALAETFERLGERDGDDRILFRQPTRFELFEKA